MNNGRINFLKNKKQLRKRKSPLSVRFKPNLNFKPTLTLKPNLKALQAAGFVTAIAGFIFLVDQKNMLQLGMNLISTEVSESTVSTVSSASLGNSINSQTEPSTVSHINNTLSSHSDSTDSESAARPSRLPTWVSEVENKNLPGLAVLEKDVANGELLIQIQTDPFFQIGTAKLNEDKKPLLREVASLLKSSESIEVEGHTDDSPIVKQRHLYQSNWDLSAARAASVVAILEDSGVDKSSLKLIGLGDSMPLVPNRDETGGVIQGNASKNRRVLLRVSF